MEEENFGEGRKSGLEGVRRKRKEKKGNISRGPTGRIYDEFIRFLLLHAHREASALANELPEESDQFRFLRASCFANLKGAVGLIMTKTSDIRISIPFIFSFVLQQ